MWSSACRLACALGLVTASALAEDPARSAAALPATARSISSAEVASAPTITVFADGRTRVRTATGGEGEKLAYSSTIGDRITAVGANLRLADDLVLSVQGGAELSRYAFWVTGQADPEQPSNEPYTVEFALHEYCPGAGGAVIPGTEGSVTISDPAMLDSLLRIEFVPDPGVIVPQSLWWSFRSSRSNVGFLGGAHPVRGFSNDILDIPGFECAANFGGWFRNEPYASFNFELWVNEQAVDSFVGYRNIYAAGPGIVTGGGDVQYADDIELQVDSCRMTGYEIGIRNFGFYQFDLHADDRGVPTSEAIPGTAKTFFNNTTTGFRLARYTFDPPIELPAGRIWATFKVNNPSGGWVLTGDNATIGETDYWYVRRNSDLSDWVYPPSQVPGRFYVVVYCAGEPADGACCDMFNTDENGDSVCRELPRMNCPNLGPHPGWMEGAVCEPDPFPFTCGLAACCTPQDDCVELTKRECEALEPLEAGRLWSRGNYCESRACPYSACLALGESCTTPDWGGRGCDDTFCCSRVCEVDAWCCEVEWDDSCAVSAQRICEANAEYDRCAPEGEFDGALALELGSPVLFSLNNSRSDSFEPGFCCNKGPTAHCDNAGEYQGLPCETDDDCGEGTCQMSREDPGAKARFQGWFRIDIPHANSPEDSETVGVRVSTCFPNEEAPDTLLQFYAPTVENAGVCEGVGRCDDDSPCGESAPCTDPSSECNFDRWPCSVLAPDCPLGATCVPDRVAECASLRVEGCNDDAGGEACPVGAQLSELCVDELARGTSYYVMAGLKRPLGDFSEPERLTIRADLVDACPAAQSPPNDYCRFATDINPGETPFTTEGASYECPFASGLECSLPGAQNDVWFRYTAVDTGLIDVATCDAEATPDTEVAIYEGCDCPTVSATSTPVGGPQPAACSGSGGGPCAVGSSIESLPVDAGECYLIRVADHLGAVVSGRLTIDAGGFDCNENGVADRCEVDCGMPGGVCDVPGCGTRTDCDNDGTLDECEGLQAPCCAPQGLDWIDPPDGAVDAGAPVTPAGSLNYKGIDRIRFSAPFAWRDDCWTFAETANNQSLWPPYPLQDLVNRILSIEVAGDESTELVLDRPIAPGECGTVTYRTDPALGGTTASATFCAHPGDVNGDGCSSAVDIIALIDAINGTGDAAWGELSTNCDRNAATGPADINCLIDLLNSGWLGVGCE